MSIKTSSVNFKTKYIYNYIFILYFKYINFLT